MDLDKLVAGKTLKGNLIVQQAEKKQARNGSYAVLQLSNGTKSVQAKRWQYEGELPAIGLVMDIEATVDEYRGTKSLNIVRWSPGTLSADEFKDPRTVEARPNLSAIESLINDYVLDNATRRFCLALMQDRMAEMLTAPAATALHHNFEGGWALHTLETMRGALAIGTVMRQSNVPIDLELLIVGAYLHDIGKLEHYEMQGAVPVKVNEAGFDEHLAGGAILLMMEANNFGEVIPKLNLIKHIILSHHGELEWGSSVKPCIPEAMIVHLADNASAKVTMMNDARNATDNDWTDKVFGLGVKVYNDSYDN